MILLKKLILIKVVKIMNIFIENQFSLPTHVHVKILDSLNQSQEQSLGYIQKKKDPDTEQI